MATRTWTGGTGTWNTSNTASWSGGAVPVAGDLVVFDGTSGGGTVTVDHASLNIASLAWGAFTGTIDFATNNNNITLTGGNSFSGSGTGSGRTLNMGNGTWTLSATVFANIWDMSTQTGLTALNANGSTIAITGNTANNRAFIGGAGRSYNIISIIGPTVANGGYVTFSTAFTIGTPQVTAPAAISIQNSTTLTWTNGPTIIGSAAGPVVFNTNAAGTAGTIACAGNSTFQWCAFRDITMTGGTHTATDSFNLGHNTGITITGPSGGGGGGNFGMVGG